MPDAWKMDASKSQGVEPALRKGWNRCSREKQLIRREEEKSPLTGSSLDWCFPQIRWAHFSFRQWIIINVRDYGTSFISFGCINSNFNNETGSPLFLGRSARVREKVRTEHKSLLSITGRQKQLQERQLVSWFYSGVIRLMQEIWNSALC